MVAFINQLILAFSTDYKVYLKGASHVFLSQEERDKRLVLSTDQADGDLQAAVPLLVCGSYFAVLFGVKPLFFIITVRKRMLRGMFHYMFDVSAAGRKVGLVKTGRSLEVESTAWITPGAVWAEF